jgi:hypothetical protein
MNFDNWYKWYYGESQPYARADGESPLRVEYGKFSGSIPTFKDALRINAQKTIDSFPNQTFDLLFSGGIDSELVLRTYRDLGHPIRVNIFRYENDYNIYDVSHAVIVCEQLGIPYNLIDFNLQKFFENDVLTVSEHAQSDRPRALVQLKFLDYVDGVPISASSDIRYFRPHDDYSAKAKWMIHDFEHDIALDRYAAFHSRPAIMQWFKWSPEIVLGWTNTVWFKKLVNDEISGKLGVVSTKIEGYRENYPDMIVRTKKTGFENIDHFVIPVQNYLKQKNGGLKYRQYVEQSLDDMWIQITGRPYYA